MAYLMREGKSRAVFHNPVLGDPHTVQEGAKMWVVWGLGEYQRTGLRTTVLYSLNHSGVTQTPPREKVMPRLPSDVLCRTPELTSLTNECQNELSPELMETDHL